MLKKIWFGPIIVMSSVLVPHAANADRTGGGTGQIIDVSASVSGFFQGGRPGNYHAPCTKGDADDKKHAIQQPRVHQEVSAQISVASDDELLDQNSTIWQETKDDSELTLPPVYKRVSNGKISMIAGRSIVMCEWSKPTKTDPETKEEVPIPIPTDAPWWGNNQYVGAYWYPVRPEPNLLIPFLFEAVQKYVPAPELAWPNMNTAGEYVYVRLPMAYTLDTVGYVRATASVDNELGEAEAWVQATPVRIRVTGPDSSSECGVGDAMTDHGDDDHPPCFLKFNRTTTDAPISVTLLWQITSNIGDANLPDEITTTWDGTIGVGELQALVNG